MGPPMPPALKKKRLPANFLSGTEAVAQDTPVLPHGEKSELIFRDASFPSKPRQFLIRRDTCAV